MKTVDDVKEFWDATPLWTGESDYEPGTKEFYEEHRDVYINDCFPGKIDPQIFPDTEHAENVLDLGCGPGFWTVEIAERLGCDKITAGDLTENAVKLAKQRCLIYGVNADVSVQNAEKTTYSYNTFTHVNCQGVIHHTPDTEACVREIARILQRGGTATISVYYRNIFLRLWPIARPFAKLLSKIGAGMKGRGRESIYAKDDVDEIVRLYDGDKNPIGKSYSKSNFIEMLSPHFDIVETFLVFFPARTLPFSIPRFLHRFLHKHCGFLIVAKLIKK